MNSNGGVSDQPQDVIDGVALVLAPVLESWLPGNLETTLRVDARQEPAVL